MSKLNVPEEDVESFKAFFKKEFDLDIEPQFYVVPAYY